MPSSMLCNDPLRIISPIQLHANIYYQMLPVVAILGATSSLVRQSKYQPIFPPVTLSLSFFVISSKFIDNIVDMMRFWAPPQPLSSKSKWYSGGNWFEEGGNTNVAVPIMREWTHFEACLDCRIKAYNLMRTRCSPVWVNCVQFSPQCPDLVFFLRGSWTSTLSLLFSSWSTGKSCILEDSAHWYSCSTSLRSDWHLTASHSFLVASITSTGKRLLVFELDATIAQYYMVCAQRRLDHHLSCGVNFENSEISSSLFWATIGPIDVKVPSGGGVLGDLTTGIAKRSNRGAQYLCFWRPLD